MRALSWEMASGVCWILKVHPPVISITPARTAAAGLLQLVGSMSRTLIPFYVGSTHEELVDFLDQFTYATQAFWRPTRQPLIFYHWSTIGRCPAHQIIKQWRETTRRHSSLEWCRWDSSSSSYVCFYASICNANFGLIVIFPRLTSVHLTLLIHH